jgi:lipopolysaccharide transport system ATP-binding protein
MDFINNSSLRNDIEIFQFGAHQNDYGDLKIIIEDVAIRSNEGAPLAYCIGGEMVSVEVVCQANSYGENPIIGFFLKDRSGQAIFGDNTYITYADKGMSVNSLDRFKVRFYFSMPILPKGKYSLTTAVASGTQLDHQIHHWINDCMQLDSESSSVCTGLVGIPMKNIIIEML